MKKLIFLIISVILLTGCSTAIAKNNDVVETTKKADEVKETTKQETTVAVKEITSTKKIYGLADYIDYLNDPPYTGNFRIEGDYVLYDIYDEYDDNGDFIPGVITRTGKCLINQLNELFALRDANQNIVKSCKTGYLANSNDKVIYSYVSTSGQNVTIPEGSRPTVPDGYVARYVAEMYARGQSISLNNGGLSSNEQGKIRQAQQESEAAQRKAEHEAYMNSQKELADAMWAEHEERDAESRAEAQENAANTAAFKQIGNNAYQKLYSILSSYSSYSENIAGKDIGELMQGSQGMTKKDNSVKKISVGAYNYKIPIEVWPEACSECLAAIDESINELEGYTSGVKDSLAKTAQMVINDLNKVRAKFH